MSKIVLLVLLGSVLFLQCSLSSKDKPAEVIPRDTSITKANAYTELFFDSANMEKLMTDFSFNDSLKDRVRSFYNARNYEYAWFFPESVADYVSTFIDMQNNYISYSADSSLYNKTLQQLIDSLSSGAYHYKPYDSSILKTELMLTGQFIRYSRVAYQGNNELNTKELDWFIPRKKINAVALLDSLVKNKGKDVSKYEPVNRQYNLLKNFLFQYYTIEKNGGWQLIKSEKRSYKEGDTAIAIIQIKKRLFNDGDFAQEDTTPVFTAALEDAVRKFQHRYGLKEDGVAGTKVIEEMNVPVNERIQQMLLNMERIRWMPAQPITDYLLVNIPEFKLHVYEKGKYQWNSKVVVGSTAHNTVIFTGNLKYIVISPYWNVPPGILRKEILPAIQRNKNYLATHNMEWYGNSVRQKPGLDNALGLVKFLFPNSYNIYLHDTPAKSLFGESTRAFSHGCIRVEQAKKLAQFLLRNDSNWDTTKINKAMNSGREKYVTLKNQVPVYIGYFTAWVDRDNKLNFRDDIYGHDKKMAEHFFANANSIGKK